ncbi:hypothetical protein P5G51_006915 [Virgibacillus sp. 179-BFC.A HS]|uniref:Uncharacterized protein n=1 Tax=Tigheibacillus jepli TaxID=3035914 RepID=A0ABU5CFR3_9BACI|nr:hypothetical protein [Virgibacillus sp. 179-BFC.A HS]MDY0405169.1 hypothetical protein [Virgibacillus sp. 179-BFC.A HS]
MINISHVTKEAFSVDIDNTGNDGKDDSVRIYMNKDLSHVVATSTYYKHFIKNVKSGKLDDFKGLIFHHNSNKRYLSFKDGYGSFDTKENKYFRVKETDLLSNNGKYVYIDGDEGDLKDGVQRIQTIENYLVGNDQYEKEFKLSFKLTCK